MNNVSYYCRLKRFRSVPSRTCVSSPELPIYKRQCPLVLGDQNVSHVPSKTLHIQPLETSTSANKIRQTFLKPSEKLETDKTNYSDKGVETSFRTCEKYQQTIDGEDIISYLQKIPLVSSIKGRQFTLLQMYQPASTFSPMATLLTPIGNQSI